MIKIFDSRITGVLLTLGAGPLVVYSLQGDWVNFAQQWQTSRFIHVMSLDFCMLSLLLRTLFVDNITGRDRKDNPLFWLFSVVPLFGALIYLCARPSLEEVDVELTANQQAKLTK